MNWLNFLITLVVSLFLSAFFSVIFIMGHLVVIGVGIYNKNSFSGNLDRMRNYHTIIFDIPRPLKGVF